MSKKFTFNIITCTCTVIYKVKKKISTKRAGKNLVIQTCVIHTSP